jgi:lipooligosaccharide transport system permease protein
VAQDVVDVVRPQREQPPPRRALILRVLPTGLYAGRAHALVERSLLINRRAWLVVLSGFFEPLFFLFALGVGFGKLVGQVAGPDGHPISYVAFVAPALLAASAMNGAVYDSTFNIFFKFKYAKLYDAMLATPVEVEDLVAAEVAWAATRALIYGTTFLVIVAIFGLIGSVWAIFTPLFLLLGGACFAMLGIAFTAVVNRVEFYSYYYTLFITPLFLFSGIFYPLDKLPDWTKVIAWFTPLYHLVRITRELVLGPDAWSVLGNAAWLLVVTSAVFVIPVTYMRRRLVA